MSFRKIEKEHLQVLIPPSLGLDLRERAAREHHSLSATTTELLCIALGRNPEEFGIAARPKVRRKKVATS